MNRIFGAVQNYAWGKPADESYVTKLVTNSVPSHEIDSSKPYAELWFGTHPNGPGMISLDGDSTVIPLFDFITKDKASTLGSTSSLDDLPFLLKILSVNKALSIQAHPNLSLAAKLHAKSPEIYRDANHKPELAVALTDFEALCCFRPLEELGANLKAFPELQEACDNDSSATEFLKSPSKETLASLFGSLMRADPKKVEALLLTLVSRLNEKSDLSADEALLVRLHGQYPGDVGVFCALVLNYITLKPGEGVFLAANLPHAYLSGNCIECMARSDNVVRAGLTPKLKDIDTLCSMLDYTPMKPTIIREQRTSSAGQSSSLVSSYTPLVKDFKIETIEIDENNGSHTLDPINGASIVLVYDGERGEIHSASTKEDILLGSSFFLSHQTAALIKNTSTAQKLKIVIAKENK